MSVAETMNQVPQIILLGGFPLLLIFAALVDATRYLIPNWISLALIVTFTLSAWIFRIPMSDVALAVGMSFAALIVGMGLFAAGWLGGGDVKLLAACALWMGAKAGVHFVLYTTLAGGLFGLLLLAMRSLWLQPWVGTGPAWWVRLVKPGSSVPYGVAIALGALAAFPESLVMVGRSLTH